MHSFRHGAGDGADEVSWYVAECLLWRQKNLDLTPSSPALPVMMDELLKFSELQFYLLQNDNDDNSHFPGSKAIWKQDTHKATRTWEALIKL